MTHPARFSPQIIDALRPILANAPHVHDPFAGTGERLGALCDELGVTFSGTEIEQPFIVDPRVMQGDSRHFFTYPCQTLTVEGMIPFPFWVVTSPTYSNGCNDNHRSTGICSNCRDWTTGERLGCPTCAAGEPHVCPFEYVDRMPEPRRTSILNHMRKELDDHSPSPCPKCDGTARRPIKRYTYRAALIEATGNPDAALTDGNTGAHGYRSGRKAAERYWQLNREVVAQWGHAERVIVNVSDFYMKDKRICIGRGWMELLIDHGWHIDCVTSVKTPRMRNGANSGRRVDSEAIIEAVKA